VVAWTYPGHDEVVGRIVDPATGRLVSAERYGNFLGYRKPDPPQEPEANPV